MITDRTQQDVDYAKSLIKKYINGTITAEELSQYMEGLKGCYNVPDLNRVEAEVGRLSIELNKLGYANNIITKVWKTGDILTDIDVERYVDNVDKLRKVFFTLQDTPPTPASYKPYQNANILEKILVDIDTLIKNTQKSWKYLGEIECGEGEYI